MSCTWNPAVQHDRTKHLPPGIASWSDVLLRGFERFGRHESNEPRPLRALPTVTMDGTLGTERAELSQQLIDLFLQGTDVVNLYGAASIGKTFLVRRISLQPFGPNSHYAYCDLSQFPAIRHAGDLIKCLQYLLGFQLIGGHCQSNTLTAEAPGPMPTLTGLGQFLQDLHSNAGVDQLLIGIDGADRIATLAATGVIGLEFLDTLWHLSQELPWLHLLLVSRHALAETPAMANISLGRVRARRMPYLSDNRIRSICSSLGRGWDLVFDGAALDYIAYLAGGHPHLAGRVVEMVWWRHSDCLPRDAVQSQRVTLADVTMAVDLNTFCASPQVKAYLEDLWAWSPSGASPLLWPVARAVAAASDGVTLAQLALQVGASEADVDSALHCLVDEGLLQQSQGVWHYRSALVAYIVQNRRTVG